MSDNDEETVEGEGEGEGEGKGKDGSSLILPDRNQLKIWKLEQEIEQHQLDLMMLLRENARAAAAPLANGIVTIHDKVTEASMSLAFTELQYVSALLPGHPITIYLDSPGGAIYDGLRLYDEVLFLRALGHEVTIVVHGWAASMGFLLLQAASPGRRLLSDEAFTLLHKASYIASGKTDVHEELLIRTRRIEERVRRIMLQRATISEAAFEKMWSRPKPDHWMDRNETVAAGFADRTRVTKR